MNPNFLINFVRICHVLIYIETSDRAQNLLHMKWRDEIESYMREMCVGKSSDDESSPDEDVVSSGMSLVTRTDEMMGRMEQKVREKSMFKNSSRSRGNFGWIRLACESCVCVCVCVRARARTFGYLPHLLYSVIISCLLIKYKTILFTGSSSMEEKACEFVEETYPNLVQRELLGSSKKGGPSQQTAAVNSDGRSASMASLSDTNEMVRGKGKKKVKWQGEQKVLTNVLEKQGILIEIASFSDTFSCLLSVRACVCLSFFLIKYLHRDV